MSQPNYQPLPSQPPRFGCRQIALSAVAAFIFGLLGALVGGAFDRDQPNAGSDTRQITVQQSNATIESVKKVSPAVVSITLTSQSTDIFGGVAEQQGGGTGFILTNDGLIATNRHVVENNPQTLTVITSDGKAYPAEVKALDPTLDFALIKIDAKDLPVVDLGNSDSLQVGEEVIAIGNALGQFQNTVTTGVLSARERTIQASDGSGQAVEPLENLLQTDAAINPGNSGGPLVNLTGQVVGVNTAVAGRAQGIGFAIPVNQVKQAVSSFQQRGRILRPSLGIRFRSLTPDVAKLAKLPVSNGAFLVGGGGGGAVLPGSAAAKAGLREGDIIVAIEGTKIDETHSLPSLLGNKAPGDEIEITYLRDGKETKVRTKLDERAAR